MKKVLIIDDEEDFCRLMGFYLSKKNCVVEYFLTFKEGLENIHVMRPDIIIADENMAANVRERIEAERDLLQDYTPHIFFLEARKSANNQSSLMDEINRLVEYIKDLFK